MALVDRNTDVDAWRKARAEPSDAAPGLTPVADEIALCAGPGPNSVGPFPQVRKRGASMVSDAPPPPGLLRSVRLNPYDASFPSRSRKLLPRFVTAAPSDRLELMSEGDGVGCGVGGGRGAICA